MIGSIIGDIIGSVYEKANIKTRNFNLFCENSRYTDDTIMTIAIANTLINSIDNKCTPLEYAINYKIFGKKYPNSGYGKRFKKWIAEKEILTQDSYGNGAAMRVSPIGFACNSINQVLNEAKSSVLITHNHIESIKGSQAIASCVYMANNGESKKYIKRYIESKFNYNLNMNLNDLRKNYSFDVTCEGSIPQSIFVFLESSSYLDTIVNAISIGGDSDTIAAMAGGIAQAFYKNIPLNILKTGKKYLNQEFIDIINKFNNEYSITYINL